MQATNQLVGPETAIALFRIARELRAAATPDGEVWAIGLLHLVIAKQPIRLCDLAAGAGLDASTITRHVQRLEQAGYLARTPDPADRRAWRLETTAAGRALLRSGLEGAAGVVAQAVCDWSGEDQRALVALTNRLAEALARVGGERGSQCP